MLQAAVPQAKCPEDVGTTDAPVRVRGVHPLTRQAHEEAVRRVVEMMRERYSDDLTLQDMARAALLSPYYANRVFRGLTGVQPRRFLAAVRFDAAKRMLLGSGASVTDICLKVGYSSLGSFTSRFHHRVGMSPRQFGRYRDTARHPAVPEHAVGVSATTHGGASIYGSTRAEDGYSGLVFVGLFPTPLPESVPLSCSLVETPGPFRLDYGKAGKAFLLAAAMPASVTTRDCLVPAGAELRVGARPILLRGSGGPSVVEANLELRPVRPTDPPIVTALPHLLERSAEHRSDDGEASEALARLSA